jgi:hypothetical protein
MWDGSGRERGTHIIFWRIFVMRRQDILKLASMPAAGPSYPAGPYRFIDREFMVITYESDRDAIREQLPEPLEPLEDPLVKYEWIRMPDSSGFGSYTESDTVIPSRLGSEEVNFARPNMTNGFRAEANSSSARSPRPPSVARMHRRRRTVIWIWCFEWQRNEVCACLWIHATTLPS